MLQDVHACELHGATHAASAVHHVVHTFPYCMCMSAARAGIGEHGGSAEAASMPMLFRFVVLRRPVLLCCHRNMHLS